MSGALALVMTKDGPLPTPPTTINAELISRVASAVPDYTANLPATLIEDVSSTCTGALVLIDQARVETINSITPFGANAFLLNQLGQIYGVPIGGPSRTSVFVVFTGTAGFPLPAGFTVGDGTHQYALADSTIIPVGGVTGALQVIATVDGIWAIPAHTVVNLVTSIPGSITLTVDNPLAGTPGTEGESEEGYRADVLTAGLVASQGSPAFLKTLLRNIPGVQSRLVAVRQVAGGWQVIVGGSGDPYEVAYAVLQGMADIAVLTGSTIDPTRDVTTTINDYPDVYTITTIAPPSQSVSMIITWNTTGTGINFVSGAQVATLAIPAIADYINSIPVGAPLNLNKILEVFIEAVSNVLPSELLTRFLITVEIDGSPVSPISGTELIQGDPESFFSTNTGLISVIQG